VTHRYPIAVSRDFLAAAESFVLCAHAFACSIFIYHFMNIEGLVHFLPVGGYMCACVCVCMCCGVRDYCKLSEH